MAEHLSEDDLEAYKRGSAVRRVLLGWDRHISQCADCRERMKAGRSLASWAERLGDAPHEEHLSYEQVVAKVEGRVAEREAFAIQAHLSHCSACREEVGDLARFRNQLEEPKGGDWRWILAATMAAAAMIVLALIPWLGRGLQSPGLQLPATWSAADKVLVEEALTRHELPAGSVPADVTSQTRKLLGPSEPDPFTVVSPISAVLESDRPTFRWTPWEPEATYRVQVYDAAFHRVMQSPVLNTTTWTADQPLQRGKVYEWQISASSANRSGGNRSEIMVPAPPAKDAKFRVLDAETEMRIERARQQGEMGHLLAAAILARAGLPGEAHQELEKAPRNVRQLLSNQ